MSGAARILIALALVGAAASGPGCGGHAPVVVVPSRAVTAGDALWARLPPGAAIVLEVDVARLRANPAVGAAITALVAPAPTAGVADEPTPGAALAAMTDAPLAGARAIVLAAYAVGTPAATTITIVDGVGAPPQATPLADGVWALAVEGDVARLLAVAGGGPSLADDRALAALRTVAMPAAAEGAAVRLTARLEPAARRALAEVLGQNDAPAAISAWLDVADDLALIAWVGGEPAWSAAMLTRLRDRAAASEVAGGLGLTPVIAVAPVARERAAARLTVVVTPARLGRVVARALERLRAVDPAGGAAPGGRVGSPR